MSLYGDYIKERENKEIVETSDGFATYAIFGDTCYIIDIYVVPAMRRSKVASELADKVVLAAKERGCSVLIGSVSVELPSATSSIKTLFGYGFRVKNFADNLLWFVKEI